MINILLMVIYVILTVSGLIMFKFGSSDTQIQIIKSGILNLQINIFSLIGLGCYAVSFVIYMLLISKNMLSFLIPVMTGIVYVSVLTLSILLLKEKITMLSIIGSALIIIGVILIALQGK